MNDKKEYVLTLDAALNEMLKGIDDTKTRKEAQHKLKERRLRNTEFTVIKSWADWKRPQ
jgi:asparagine synthetase A